MNIKENHEEFEKIIQECIKLRWSKLQDYGPTYNEYGVIGILVKLGDKYGRIKNLYMNNKKPNYEGIRDSAIDLINYTTMLIMELDKKEDKQ